MFFARIVSPRGSLYLSAEATPYDLENLRMHVHELQGTAKAETRLELSIDGANDAMRGRMAVLLRQLEAEGIRVLVSAAAPMPPAGEHAATPALRRVR